MDDEYDLQKADTRRGNDTLLALVWSTEEAITGHRGNRAENGSCSCQQVSKDGLALAVTVLLVHIRWRARWLWFAAVYWWVSVWAWSQLQICRGRQQYPASCLSAKRDYRESSKHVEEDRALTLSLSFMFLSWDALCQLIPISGPLMWFIYCPLSP